MGEGKKASQPSRRLKNKRRNLRKEKGTRRTGGQASSQSSGEPDRGTPPGAGTGEPGRLGAPHHGAPWTGLGAAAAHTPLGGSGHERPGRRPRPVPGAPGPPAPAAGARQASTREDQGGVRYAPSVLTSPSHPAQWALPRRASPHFSGLQSAALPHPHHCPQSGAPGGEVGGSRWLSLSRSESGHAPLLQPSRDSNTGEGQLGTSPWPPPSWKTARPRLHGVTSGDPVSGPGGPLGTSPTLDTEGKLGNRRGERRSDPPGAGASRRVG